MKIRALVAMVAIVTLTASGGADARSCVRKGGEGYGITLGLAKYNALGAIKLFNGDFTGSHIFHPMYSCKPNALGWTCHARALFCGM